MDLFLDTFFSFFSCSFRGASAAFLLVWWTKLYTYGTGKKSRKTLYGSTGIGVCGFFWCTGWRDQAHMAGRKK